MKQFVLFILTILIISCNNKKNDPQPNQTTNNNPNVITNNPPVLQSNLSYTATTATQLSIDLSSKITDSNNNTWSITTATVNHGSATISGTTINYTSNTSYTGNDTITVSIKDSKGAISTGQIGITVNSSSTSTNHVPSVNNANTLILAQEQWLGNTYGYLIYIKAFSNYASFNVVDTDNDNVAITSITGYSSNIQSIRGIATNLSATDIANGNFSGDISIIPYSRIYSGVETFNITFSDGKSTITKTFTIQLGSDAKLQATNILNSFMNRPLTYVALNANTSFMGTLRLNSDASLITTMTQQQGGFFGYQTSPSTYSYSITKDGWLMVSVTANNTTTITPYLVETYYANSSYLQLTNLNTQVIYGFE